MPWPRFANQEGVPEYLSQNVPTLSTFTNAQFGANHNCNFWDGVIVYQP
jgi:para-nitrobenzyl esterase